MNSEKNSKEVTSKQLNDLESARNSAASYESTRESILLLQILEMQKKLKGTSRKPGS